MKIRTQLIIGILLFCLALLIIAASIVQTNEQVDRLKKQEMLVDNIVRGAPDLRVLSNDYLLYNESQQLDRWNAKFTEFSNDVSNLSVNTPQQQVLVNNIKADQQQLKEVFDNVVSSRNNQDLVTNSSEDKAFIQLSSSRLGVQTRGIIFDASSLYQLLLDQENQIRQTSNLIIMVLLGLFGTFILAMFLLIFGSTIKSIGNLKAGAKIIGSGNLDYRIKENKRDEVSELAYEFNQMTTRLKTVTASKADLENEIAERKHAEEALRESEERFRALADNIPNLAWMANADGWIFWYNEQWYDYTGATLEEMQGWGWQKVHHPDYVKAVSERWGSRIKAGQPYEDIFPLRGKDGNYRWFLTRVTPIRDEQGNIQRWFGTNTDITRLRQVEEDLTEAKMQSDLYIDLMGHDISNMHQIILGQLEMAQEMIDADGKLEGENRELIDISVKTLNRSAKLIQNIRNIQKLRSGEHKFEKIDLGSVLDEVVQAYSKMPDRDIIIDYAPAHGYYLIVNPLLKDIFINLLDNAVKHCEDPVRISVNVSRVENNDGSYYQVVVEDNGHGVPDDKKAEIFNRLKRGDTKARGTGLGLYIVRTLVEGFDGTVSLEDRVPGDHTKGAKFIVRLPIEGGHRCLT